MTVKPDFLQLMQQEVARQSRYALIAAEGIEFWLRYQPDDPAYSSASYSEGQDRLWSSVQSFLAAAAMVSKLLWGVSRRHRGSRERLRTSLGVTAASPLRDRDLRNTFEHFDERLEAFFEELPGSSLVDAYVGSFMGITGRDPRTLLRGFDPDSFAVTYERKVYELRPMIAELRRIRDVADGV